MKPVLARIALLSILATAAVACEDGEGPTGEPSTFDVFVYIERGDSVGMHADDTPVSATVTVAANDDDLVLVDSTGADGVVSFPNLPPGGYTVSHVATPAPAGTELDGETAQTVLATFAGDTVVTLFIYRPLPGSLSGVVYRDDDGSDAFEAGLDSTFAGFEVAVYAGDDTLDVAVAEDTTGADGAWDLGELAGGEYTLLVRPITGTAIVGGNPRPVTIVEGMPTELEIEIVGEPTGPVVSVEEARAAEEGATVKVRGVVTDGQGTYRDNSVYLQDATAGILVFGIDSAAAFARGDSLQIIGERSSFRGETQIIATSWLQLGTGILPEPHQITTTDLNEGLFPAELARLNATVDSIGDADAASNFTVYVRDEVGEARLFVDVDTDIEPGAFAVDTLHTIEGVLSVFDADDDGTIEEGDYRLMPRDTMDVIVDDE